MPVGQTQVSVFVAVCDGPDCNRAAIYEGTPEGRKKAVEAEPWLDQVRYVILEDQTKLLYCSDVCEVNAIGAGKHRSSNQKKIQQVGKQAEIQALAMAEQRARETTKALQSGEGKITLG
jgi:hypothetical protein